MTYTYKKVPLKDDSGNKTGDRDDIILRKEDKAFIPLTDEDNSDYIEYKEWLDAGNTPEAS